MASLTRDERKDVVIHPGGTSLNSSGDSKVKSIEKIKGLCTLAGNKAMVTSDVVERDIPSLLSEPEMKTTWSFLHIMEVKEKR